MANTDITSRTQYDRTDLAAGGEGIRRGAERGSMIYSGIALIVGAVLCYAAIQTIDSWAQWLVLGVLIAFTVALMFAIGPNRVGAGSRFNPSRGS